MTEAGQSNDYSRGQPRRHHSLYFDDGTLVIQVEKAIFKVHRSVLARYSTVIQDMLSIPIDERINDGDDECPLAMNGDNVVGWELLLGVQYNFPLSKPKVPKGEDLLLILSVAHKYCMETIEEWIIEQLKTTSSYEGFIDLLVASRIVDSNELYEDGLQRLIATKMFPTLGQAERMGIRATHVVMKAAADAAIAESNATLKAKHAKDLANVDNRRCRHCSSSTNWECANRRCGKVQVDISNWE